MKVLIVEDDLMTADMAEEALAGQGYEVCGIARTIDEALELDCRHQPDLALIDQRLANKGRGTDLVARFGDLSKIGILYASGNIDEVILNATAGHACLAKPYRSIDLLQSMKAVSDIVAGKPIATPLPMGFRTLPFPSNGERLRTAVGASAQLAKLLKQQAALADFGSFALRERDLTAILREAARVCADGLSAPLSKICRYREKENDLIIEAAFGWDDGVIGNIVSEINESSPQGRTFITRQPSVCNDLRIDRSYSPPSFYRRHGVISTVDVLITGDDKPYGVLEVDESEQKNFDQHDIDFLTGFANVLAAAVSSSLRMETLAKNVREMKVLVEEREVLAQELRHRVRNNLQLVYGMLGRLSTDFEGQPAQRGINAVARRVATLAEVYNRLLGAGMTRTADCGVFLRSLCESLADVQASSEKHITLNCECDSLVLELDTVTTLGIVAAELIANSYEHAFPNGNGTISVQMGRTSMESSDAKLTIRDNGIGFTELIGSKRQGLGLVRRLTKQLCGNIQHEETNGTLWTIRFPVDQDGQQLGVQH
jgi:two-component sensor histidine kinase